MARVRVRWLGSGLNVVIVHFTSDQLVPFDFAQ